MIPINTIRPRPITAQGLAISPAATNSRRSLEDVEMTAPINITQPRSNSIQGSAEHDAAKGPAQLNMVDSTRRVSITR